MLFSAEEEMPHLKNGTTKVSSFERYVSCAMVVMFSVTTVVE